MRRHCRLAAAVGCIFPAALCAALFGPGVAASSTPVDEVERAITRADELHREGALMEGSPFRVTLSSGETLTFAAGTFDADLERAFALMDRLLRERGPAPAPASASAASVPPPAAAAPPAGRIETLRRAELPAAGAARPGAIDMDYSVYEDYKAAHNERIRARDQAAEADMRTVIAERQTAAQAAHQRRVRKQQIQDQAMKWQAQLDKEASEAATARAKWEMEHGFGAYVRRFIGMMVKTSVGSFTGAFFGNLGTNLGNEAVRQLFPAMAASPPAASGGSSAASGSAGPPLYPGVTGGVPTEPGADAGSYLPAAPRPVIPPGVYNRHVAPYWSQGNPIPPSVYWRQVAPRLGTGRDIRY